jgi:hypothetical protein
VLPCIALVAGVVGCGTGGDGTTPEQEPAASSQPADVPDLGHYVLGNRDLPETFIESPRIDRDPALPRAGRRPIRGAERFFIVSTSATPKLCYLVKPT